MIIVQYKFIITYIIMLRRDYIMKLIQQLMDSLFLLMNEKEMDEEKRREKFEKLYKEYLDESSSFYINASLEDILQHFKNKYGEEEVLLRIDMLSDILYNDGLLQQDNVESRVVVLQKALEVLIYLNDHSDTYSIVRQGKIETINEELRS